MVMIILEQDLIAQFQRLEVAFDAAATALTAGAHVRRGAFLESLPLVGVMTCDHHDVAAIGGGKMLLLFCAKPGQQRFGAHVVVDQRPPETVRRVIGQAVWCSK